MSEQYFKKSTITGRTYDLFSIVRILNISQVIFYLSYGVPLQDIEISTDRRDKNKPVLVFYFNRDDTKEAFDKWCEKKDMR